MSSGKRPLLEDETDAEENGLAKKQKVVVQQEEDDDDVKPAAVLSEADLNGGLSVDEAAILAILEAVKVDPTDTEFVVHACGCLGRFLQRNNENLNLFIEEGLILLTSIMKDHLNHAELQIKGADLICATCNNVENMKEDSNKSNGIWAIITAMKALQSSTPILTRCCIALYRMTKVNQ